MKQEIFEWYVKRHYNPHKMHAAAYKWGFTQAQVEAAMEHCYNKIVNEGKKVLDIDIARYVKNVCKEVDTTVKDAELKKLYESNDRWEQGKQFMYFFAAANVVINFAMWLFIAWGV